ncbi:MAG TPA: DinB family protein [Bryobacteraceae bacterium]|jgi:hypothetical protein
MTDKEREKALDLLARTRVTLQTAVDGVTAEESVWKPIPERWSILEYVEHLAISDDGLISMVKRIMAEPPTPETPEQRAEREQHIRSTPIARGTNHAPAALVPPGRFATVSEAMAAFEAARDRTLEFARTVDGDMRSHFANHSVLGPLDAYQWLTANARHVEMHAAHIRELREQWAAQSSQ